MTKKSTLALSLFALPFLLSTGAKAQEACDPELLRTALEEAAEVGECTVKGVLLTANTFAEQAEEACGDLPKTKCKRCVDAAAKRALLLAKLLGKEQLLEKNGVGQVRASFAELKRSLCSDDSGKNGGGERDEHDDEKPAPEPKPSPASGKTPPPAGVKPPPIQWDEPLAKALQAVNAVCPCHGAQFKSLDEWSACAKPILDEGLAAGKVTPELVATVQRVGEEKRCGTPKP